MVSAEMRWTCFPIRRLKTSTKCHFVMISCLPALEAEGPLSSAPDQAARLGEAMRSEAQKTILASVHCSGVRPSSVNDTSSDKKRSIH